MAGNRKTTTRTWAARGLAVLLVPTVLAACEGGGSNTESVSYSSSSDDYSAQVSNTPAPRSSETFCSVLNDGAADLDAQTAAAGDSAEDQLMLLLQNIPDFTRLLRRLEPLAPPELQADMSTVVDLWTSQADAASDMVNNPFGAIAGALMTSLMSGSSVQAVDDYAHANCGRGLFT